MKRNGFIKTVAVALMFVATLAFAQYPGPGYPPSSGGGSGSASFPVSSVSGAVEIALLGIAPTAGSFYGYDSANDLSVAYGLNITPGQLGLLLGANDFSSGAGINESLAMVGSPEYSLDLTDGGDKTYSEQIDISTFSSILNDDGANFRSAGTSASVLTSTTTWSASASASDASGETVQSSVSASSGNNYSSTLVASANGFGGSSVAGLTANAPAGVVVSSYATPRGVADITAGSKPTCDDTVRRSRWFVAGGAGVADTYEVCMKSAADTYAWVVVATNP